MEGTLAIIGALGTLFAIIFGFLTFSRNKSKDESAIMSDLGYIKAMLEDQKQRLKKIENQQADIVVRVAKVEESAKSAHKRLDEMGAVHYPDKYK